MPRYEYIGEGERVIPDLKLIVKKGDTFDAPDGFMAQGVVLVSAGKSAPAEKAKKTEVRFNPDAKDGDKDGFVQDGTIHERPVVIQEEKPSAPSDISAGA